MVVMHIHCCTRSIPWHARGSTARHAGRSYTLFDRIVRTGFGADGLNYPEEDSGLVVRRGDKILSARTCTSVQPIAAEVRDLLPEGALVEH